MPSSSGALKPSRSGSTQKMAANIKVVVRVRPSNSKESVANSRNVVDVVDDKMLVFDPKEEQLPFFYQGQQQPSRGFLKRPNKELKFVFDNVFNQYASNRDIFEVTTKEILASLMEGYNCSVFVYGATGAGKTFTMIGSQESPGITYLTMEHLFYSINSQEKDREFEIGVSYLEVYNENVYDLLKTHKVPLQLREDAKYGVMVAGLTLQTIKTAQELLNMLENGNKNRTQHPTDANAESSRSHAVFQVYITMRYKISSEVRMVKLSMIDLAGSERASATGCHGDRFKEGANINRSLLSLGNCINKLADGSNYIPYRDSKLTRLLKDSLGGNCKTVMIANVSPSSLSFEDTYNTLKYAARANKIQLSIKKNIVDGDVRSSQYVKLNEELKKKLKELEAKLALSSVPVAPVNDKAKKEWRRRLEDCESTHADCQNRVLNLMVRQRVLAMRHRLRTRAFSHVTDLVHRSSYEAMDQVYTEEVPRHERVVENYHRQAVSLDSKITNAWKKWQTSNKHLKNLCQKALQELPDLADFIKVIELQSELRQSHARDNLRQKLVAIENKEINAFADYVSEMPALLKKLYFTLKGYDKAPPALTEEYLEIMRKAKHATGITWSDDSEDTDPHFDFITNLDLNNLNSIPEFKCKKEVNSDLTDSEDLTDQENQLSDKENQLPVLSPLKRKGTPIKLPNNETIIIDDSFEALDTTKTLSNKKVKKEFPLDGVENANVLNANDLNSTFVLAGKIDGLNKKVKDEFVYPVKRGLFDRPNNIQRPVPDKSKILKPIIGKAAAFRRPLTAPPVASSKSGFGSSLSRDGTPLQRNVQADQQRRNINERSVGFKAVRGRERVQNHPYTRPAARR